MHRRSVMWLLCCVSLVSAGMVDSVSTGFFREYRLLLGHPEEMEVIANTGVTLNKVMSDLYFKGFGPKLPAKVGKITEVAWSVFWTFSTSLWPHEFGHWARARQTGGDFIFTGFTFPFPTARMEFPAAYKTPEDATLPSIGGFEINSLMRRQAHDDFYRNRFAHSDELVHSFIQEVYYPFYAFVVAFADVDNPYTWTNTRGDPVEGALSVYRTFTGREALRSDSTVDPDLIRQYRESVYMSVLWTALDPMLYISAKAFNKNMKDNSGLMRPWMLFSRSDIGWTWGTSFNPSPLGYELYFTNYLRLEDRLYSLYIKGGRPYKNIGAGFSVPDLVSVGKFSLGSSCDFWMQDVYGKGLAASLLSEFRLSRNSGLLVKAGWKERGYVMGRNSKESALLMGGGFCRF
jgi:hypothetical protein